MDKLIKASDAVDIVAKHSALYGDGDINTDDGEALLYDIMSEIMNLPSAEPEPKTGEWNFVGNQMYKCTNCGVAYTEYQFEKMRVRYNDPKFPRFCPNCGSYNGGDSDDQQ